MVLWSSTLLAQSTPQTSDRPGFFGDVGVMAGAATDGMPDGPALALGLGARVSAKKSIRFELKMPKRHVRVSGQPTSSVYVREATRVASYSLLWARHLGPARQVHVEWLAGLSGMMFSSKGNSVLRLRSADGSIRQFNDEIDNGEHSTWRSPPESMACSRSPVASRCWHSCERTGPVSARWFAAG